VTPLQAINRYPVEKREDNGKIVATEPRPAKTWATAFVICPGVRWRLA
jgi:hypothetical protein